MCFPRLLAAGLRVLAGSLVFFLVTGRVAAAEPPTEKKNAGTLLRQLGFTNVDLTPPKAQFGRPKLEAKLNGQPFRVILGLEQFGSRWLQTPAEPAAGAASGLAFDSFRLADISPSETGLAAYMEADVALGAVVLERYSAIYLPALNQVYFRENPLSPQEAAGLEQVWLRSGFEQHPVKRSAEGPVIAGAINGRPAKFGVNLRSGATMLNLNRAKEYGFKPVSVNLPANTFSRMEQPLRLTVRSGPKASEDESLKDAKIERLDLGGTQVAMSRFLLSRRLFEGDSPDGSQEPLAGQIGLDLLAQAGAVVDFRGKAVFLLKGRMGPSETDKKPARK